MLKPISPGTPQWDAWLAHYRGTKTELVMMLCQREARPFHAMAEWPPNRPRADRLRSPASTVAAPNVETRSPIDCRSHQIDALIEEIAERQNAKRDRDAVEAETERHRHKMLSKAERLLDEALAAAQENRFVDVNGSHELGLVAIEDPLEAQALIHVGRGAPMRVRKNAVPRTRVVSLRDDAVGRLAKWGALGVADERDLRLRAARRYQDLWALVDCGGKAIDYSRDIVDGGVFVTPDSDSRTKALDELKRIDRALGSHLVRIVRAVLIPDQPLEPHHEIEQAAATLGLHGRRERRLFRDELRSALDHIAKLANLRPAKGKERRYSDYHADMAAVRHDPDEHRRRHMDRPLWTLSRDAP